MLKDTLNKGIFTPIAIAIVLILVILVGSFTWWQYGEMEKETTGGWIELPKKASEELSLLLKSCQKLTELSSTEREKLNSSCENNEDCIIKHPTEGCIRKGSNTDYYDSISNTINEKDCIEAVLNIVPTIGCQCSDNKCVSIFEGDEICTQNAALDYTGEGKDPCDRSCQSDEDCKEECGCECISKDEECIYTGVECEAPNPDYGCKCINNTCSYKYIGKDETTSD